MGGKAAKAPINEAIYLLNSLAPRRLAELKGASTAIAPQLGDLGVDAGSDDDWAKDAVLVREAAIVTASALRVSSRRCWEGIRVAASRLRVVRRAKFAAYCVSIIGGSGGFGAVAGDQPAAAMVCTILAVVSSIVGAFAEYKQSHVGDRSVEKLLSTLTAAVFDVESTADQLEIGVRSNARPEALAPLVEQGNALCRQITTEVVPLLAMADAVPQGSGAGLGKPVPAQ
jgi:hypothetical protein